MQHCVEPRLPPIVIETRYKATGDVPAARTQAKKAVTTAVKGQDLVDTASYAELQKLYKFANAAGLQFEQLKRGAASSTADLKRVLGPAFREIGSNVLAGIKTGLANADSELAKIAQGMGSGLISKTKNALGIKSPSRPFMEIGKNVVAGLEIGLENFDALQAKMVGKMREFVAVMRMEAAKIQGISMSPGMSQSAGSHGSRQYMSPIGPLSEGSKEPWAFSQYRYQPFMAQPGQTRGAGVRPMRERFPFAAAPSIMGTTTSPSMLGASFPALPSAGMTGGNAVRQAQLQSRMAAAYARSAAREASVLGESQMNARVSGQVPLGDPTPRLPAGNRGGALALRDAGAQTPLSLDYYKNAVKYSEALKVANASTRNFSASQIPLIGGIKNLAGEFGQAAKQVLLYGTAYKGLAFLTSLPGQILNAAKSQQQFTNGLKVATQDTGTFAKELLYVDNVQRAFGLNLETTRTGFTRLYASMAPTGFDSGSIEKLFTGISAATASLQLTPDKAERVIYAFGQMASKGQIMSEEVKGQLGDVLPGALAIFSKAAGMSVKEFSKAMEDGEFVGTRFREVFAKVSDELMNRFGTGAQVAGRSLQGLINTVGGDFQRTLESFAPLANAAAQATLGPLTGMLREVSMAAQIAMGEQDRVRKQLEAAQADVATLQMGGADAKEIKAAEQNVAALAARYEVLNEAVKDPAIAQQVKNIEAFVSEMQKAATFTMNLAGVIGSVLNPLFTFLGGNLTSVIGNLALLVLGFNAAKLAAMLMMGVLNTMTAISGITATGAASTTVLAGAFRLLGVQATGAQVATIGFGVAIKGLLISTGIGAVIVLLGSLAAAFLSVGNKAKEAADRAKRSIDSMADAARTGNVSLIEMELSVNKADRQDLEGLIKNVEELKGTKGARGVELVTLTPEMKREAKRLGVEVAGEVSRGSVLGSLKGLRAPLAKVVNEGSKDLEDARKRAESLGMNKPTPGATPPETPGDGTGKPPKEQSLESYYSLQNQLADANTQAEIERIEAQFEHARAMVNAEYDLREARANSFQKKAIAFQREIFAITADRDAALLKSRNKILAESGKVAGGAGGMGGGTAGAYLQGNIGPTSTGPHFDVKKMGGGYFPRNYLDQYVQVNGKPLSSGTTVPGGTFAAHQRRNSHGWDYAFGGGRQAATLTGGAEWMGGAPTAHGEARKFKLPTGEEFQFLHGKSEGIGERAGAPRPVAGSERKRTVAEAKTQLSMNEMRAAAIEKEAEATKGLEIATAKYVQSIVPTSEQQLQNQLLAQRIDLTRNSFSPEILEAQLAFAEQQIEATENIKLNEEAIKTLTAAQGDNSKQINALTDANNQLKANLPVSAIQLYSKSINEQVLLLAQRNDAAKKDAADQERISDLIIGGMSRQAAEAKLTADNLKNNYKKALEEATRQVDIAAAAEEAFAITKRMSGTLTEAQTAQYNALADALKKAREERERLEGMAPAVESTATGIESIGAPKTAKSYIADAKDETQQELDQLTNWGYQVAEGGKAIGSAFGQAFKDIVSGSVSAREALANMMQSIADHFLDMAAQIIAKQITMIIYGTIMKVLGLTAGASSAGGGLSSGFDAGGASALPTDAGGWSQSFATPLKFANGGIAAGGFTAFANGGMVTGPTMGLVGEGKYNEAIVPLPDGKSIPVQMTGTSGGGSLRDAMNSNSVANSPPVLNMSFQSTSINGVEYVSRDQLESAMAETRRNATRDGAKRGMTMTLDRIQNSSSTRRKVGI